MKFERKVKKMYPRITEEKLETAVETGIKFSELVKKIGSLSFAITAWRHMGNRTEERLLVLADAHFNK